MELILIVNEEVPGDLRRALDKEAKEEGVTVNDVAASIIAKHYGIKWEPSGNPYRPLSTRFKLRVNEKMHRALSRDAWKNRHTLRGVALSLLAQHYGTKAIDPTRRPRKEVA